MTPALQAALAAVPAVVAFRALPAAIYLACSSERLLFRIAGPCVYVGVVVGCVRDGLPLVLFGLCALAYFALASAFIHYAAIRQLRTFPSLVTFGICAILFIAVPGLVSPVWFVTSAVVWGWEMLLSSYSYAKDVGGTSRPTSVRNAVFFIVVDPTFVYPERSLRLDAQAPRLPGFLRIIAGSAAMLVSSMLPMLGYFMARSRYAYVEIVIEMSIAGIAIYLSHSGLASIQIGILRLVGYRTPERYAFPFLAKSPQEFWMRFNIWVGAWARRYLYYPLALSFGRSFRSAPRPMLKSAALILTFTMIGLLHDLPEWVTLGRFADASTRPALAFTGAFVVFGIIFLVWIPVQRGFDAIPTPTPLLHRAINGANWAVYQQVFLLMSWICFPMIQGQRSARAWLQEEAQARRGPERFDGLSGRVLAHADRIRAEPNGGYRNTVDDEAFPVAKFDG